MSNPKPKMKTCSCCGELKPSCEYYLRTGTDQLQSNCKACQKESKRRHVDRIRADKKRYFKFRVESSNYARTYRKKRLMEGIPAYLPYEARYRAIAKLV